MPRDKKIMEIVRQEKLLEKQIAALARKQRSLASKQQRLLNRRWTLAIRKLIGKDVKIAGYFVEEDRKLDGQAGVLRRVHRDGTCEVDFGPLGQREFNARDLLGSDLDEWSRLVDGE